jgi:2,5-diketo-D-gluconate reductase B
LFDLRDGCSGEIADVFGRDTPAKTSMSVGMVSSVMEDLAVPALGLGTYGLTDPERCATMVETALEAGYRHVDTAQIYENERSVGRGLARADVDPESVTVATKVCPENLGYDDVLASVKNSRNRLCVDRIDLLYVHWPQDAYDPAETWQAFDALVDRGVVERVGVSNFTPDLIAEAMGHANAPIVANQVEVHPLLPQQDLRTWCHENGVTVVAYSPLAKTEVLDLAPVRSIAADRGCTPAQVVLAWHRASGVAAIPKASGDHVVENLRSRRVDLTAEEIARIDAVKRRTRVVDRPEAPWNRSE